MESKRVYKVCLTGGPRAGKTTCAAHLQRHFGDEFVVFVLPELAKAAKDSGVPLSQDQYSPQTYSQLGAGLCEAQIALEHFFEDLSQAQPRDVLLVCDRGVCDYLASVPKELKQQLLEDKGWTAGFLSYERYDLVVHLVTAAIGAEKAYGLEPQAVRCEDLRGAQEADRAIREEWLGHPRLHVIDNACGDFAVKVARVLDCVQRTCKLESPRALRKFLLHGFEPAALEKHAMTRAVTETLDFLVSSDQLTLSYALRREDEQRRSTTYFSCVRELAAPNKGAVEKRRLLSEKHYFELLKNRNKQLGTVRRSLRVFAWENAGVVDVLTVQNVRVNGKQCCWLRSAVDKRHFPAFLNVGSDVTDLDEYRTSFLAHV